MRQCICVVSDVFQVAEQNLFGCCYRVLCTMPITCKLDPGDSLCVEGGVGVIPYKWGLTTPAHTKTMSPVPPFGDVGAHVQ